MGAKKPSLSHTKANKATNLKRMNSNFSFELAVGGGPT